MDLEAKLNTDSLPKPRVLVAEDCADTRSLLALILEQAGVEVFSAENGKDCLELACMSKKEGRPFDLVLMDIHMPEVDGLTAAKMLRKAGFHKPIVALTATSSLAQRNASIYSGCNSFLAKATIKETLVPTLKQYLKQTDSPWMQ